MAPRYNGPLLVLLKKLIPKREKDPWEHVLSEEEIEAIFASKMELCVNCSHPESRSRWFCNKCGYPGGAYTPYMPYLYLHWLGWLFRSSVDGSVRLTKFNVCGLIIASLMQYGFFAPLYWYRLAGAATGHYLGKKKESGTPDLEDPSEERFDTE